jgi:hypothetical protein
MLIAQQRPQAGVTSILSLAALAAVVAAAVIGLSLVVAEPKARISPYNFPAFRMRTEETREGIRGISTELEWRGRSDWTERQVRSDGSIGLVTKEVQDGRVLLHGMGPTHADKVSGGSVEVPGVWFRDIVFTLPSPTESRSQTGSLVTMTRKTPIDVEEWDADATTGIPLAYRKLVDGRVIQEIRVVSLVLEDGTVIR